MRPGVLVSGLHVPGVRVGGRGTQGTLGWQSTRNDLTPRYLHASPQDRAGSVYADTNCIGFAWHSARSKVGDLSSSRKGVGFASSNWLLYHITFIFTILPFFVLRSSIFLKCSLRKIEISRYQSKNVIIKHVFISKHFLLLSVQSELSPKVLMFCCLTKMSLGSFTFIYLFRQTAGHLQKQGRGKKFKIYVKCCFPAKWHLSQS